MLELYIVDVNKVNFRACIARDELEHTAQYDEKKLERPYRIKVIALTEE